MRMVTCIDFMKVEVMPPKTNNNMNFQPEQIITDQSINFFVKNEDWGRGGLIERGGLLTFLL